MKMIKRLLRNFLRVKSTVKKQLFEDHFVADSSKLHGHDMSVWHYLGQVNLGYGEVDHPTFMFCRKDNTDIRSYTITGYQVEEVRRYHGYVTKHLEPWRFGEAEVYFYVKDLPSNWLKNYMIKEFGCSWDVGKKWWVPTTEAHKYLKATEDQKKKDTEPKEKTTETDGNVVKVNFKK